MNKKKKSRKFIIGGLAAAMIVPSGCDSELVINENDSFTHNDDEYNALSIKLYLSEKDWSYINYLGTLSTQILEEPEVTSEFIADPDKYLNQVGYDKLNLTIHDDYMQVLRALADRDIRTSLQNNDLNTFMRLCKEKGYVKNYSSHIINLLNNSNKLTTRKVENIEESFAIPAAILAAVWLAVAVHTMYVFWVRGVDAVQKEDYFNVLLLNQDETTAYMATEQFIENEVGIVLQHIKQEQPELPDKQMVEIKNFLIKNMVELVNLNID